MFGIRIWARKKLKLKFPRWLALFPYNGTGNPLILALAPITKSNKRTIPDPGSRSRSRIEYSVVAKKSENYNNDGVIHEISFFLSLLSIEIFSPNDSMKPSDEGGHWT
jgi:hypothetical protein